jgi:lantibiotic modifying enzyme
LADGSRIVHKPRGVTAHLCLTELVALTNRLVPGFELDTVDALAGNGYGWTRHVRPAPLPAADRAGAYFHRLGGLLALLHLVRATDMHHENLIADGDQPLLVDVETLFQPRLVGDGPDPAGAALARSVARIGVLPAVAGRHGLTDVSGIGGDAGRPRRAANRPEWAGRPIEPADHADAVLAGFRQVYDTISRHRTEFAQALRGCADVPVRVVVRPTRQYADLLAAARGPALLRLAGARERALLDACAGSAAIVPGLPGHEAADLNAGDVPLFTTRADGRDLDSTSGRLPAVFTSSGLADALDGLAAFGDFDRRDQEWVIAASLASRRVAVTDPRPVPADAVTTVGTDEALSAACAVADRVVTASFGADRVNWVGLEPVDDSRWLVLPMGAGLAHGYTGVALFLAQVGRLSGVVRYAEVARHALDAVPDLLAALHGRPESIAAVGAGGLNGFGGIGYALARLAALLDDREVAGWARAVVPLAAEAAELDAAPGWADGLDGCAAAMRALDAEIGCAAARDLAVRCTADAGEPDGPPRWCRHGALDWAAADLSLCHGELGRADVSANDLTIAARHHRTKAVLAALRRDGPRCATPDQVPTPGLLTGLAGVGHGLLRLAFPDRVPSVLLLEPSRPLP